MEPSAIAKKRKTVHFAEGWSIPIGNAATAMGKEIQSNMSYLQKLFIMPDKPDKFVQFGHDLLEMIIAALNQNQVKIETAKASSFVEKELVAWFHRLIFDRSERFYQRQIQNPRVALGNVTADGTLGNLTSLLVAREKAFPPDRVFPGVRQAGMSGALQYYGYERGVILVSVRGHYSIRKAAGILGFGE
jgi:hypothetical protein